MERRKALKSRMSLRWSLVRPMVVEDGDEWEKEEKEEEA